MKEFCLVCHKFLNDQHWRYSDYGWVCSKHFKPRNHEWVPDRILNDRKEYAKSIIQPFRAGYPSAEFKKAYPNKAKKIFSQVKEKPKNVWGDILPSNWEKTK